MKKWFLFISITLMANMSTLQASSPLMAEISTSNIMSVTNNSINDDLWFKEMSYDMMTGNRGNITRYINSIWWSNLSGQVLIDLGSSFNIQDIAIQVDSNDTYKLDYSIDNDSWSNLFIIAPEDGDEMLYGMDTMSSDSLSTQFVTSMDFSMVEARYLRLSASGGDRLYFVSELQAFGTPINELNTLNSSFFGAQSTTVSPVPAPPSLMLFSAGLVVLTALQYRRKKLISKT